MYTPSISTALDTRRPPPLPQGGAVQGVLTGFAVIAVVIEVGRVVGRQGL
ncbi:hypothetical protein AB0N07_25235 [Streptomyces sp. NPDC051172]